MKHIFKEMYHFPPIQGFSHAIEFAKRGFAVYYSL